MAEPGPKPNAFTLSGVDLAIAYDPTKLALNDAEVGQLLVGFGLSVNASTPGIIRLTMAANSPLHLAHEAAGTLAVLNFTILGGAGAAARINLLAANDSLRTALFDELGRDLTLSPAPTNGETDVVDGELTILTQAD